MVTIATTAMHATTWLCSSSPTRALLVIANTNFFVDTSGNACPSSPHLHVPVAGGHNVPLMLSFRLPCHLCSPYDENDEHERGEHGRRQKSVRN